MSFEAAAPAAAGRGRRSLVAGVGVVVAGALPGFMAASLAPRIRDDFAFSASSVGIAVAAFYLVSMIASSPSGRLVDRAGADRGLRLSAGLTAIACVGVYALAGSAPGLVALLVLGGFGNALVAPAVGALLKREVPAGRQGVAFGAQQAGAPLGALLAGLALPVVAIPFDWRLAYLGAAALGVLGAALAPTDKRRVDARPRPQRRRGPSAIHALAVAAALASAAGTSLVSFIVLYSIDSGVSEPAAGLVLGGVSFAAMVGRILLGALADRGGQDALRPLPPMLALSVGAYLLLIAGEPALITLAAVAAGGLGWAWPGALTLAVVQRSPEAPAWAVGVMMSGLFAGAVVGPFCVGLLAERDLFATAWAVCAALVLGAAATIVATRRGERRGGP